VLIRSNFRPAVLMFPPPPLSRGPPLIPRCFGPNICMSFFFFTDFASASLGLRPRAIGLRFWEDSPPPTMFFFGIFPIPPNPPFFFAIPTNLGRRVFHKFGFTAGPTPSVFFSTWSLPLCNSRLSSRTPPSIWIRVIALSFHLSFPNTILFFF